MNIHTPPLQALALCLLLVSTGCATTKAQAPTPVTHFPQHNVEQLSFSPGAVARINTGTLRKGDTLTYRYQGVPGEKLLLRNMRNRSIDAVTITVYSPSGKLVGSAIDEMTYTFSEGGQYRFAISLASDIEGAYSLFLQDPHNGNNQ